MVCTCSSVSIACAHSHTHYQTRQAHAVHEHNGLKRIVDDKAEDDIWVQGPCNDKGSCV